MRLYKETAAEPLASPSPSPAKPIKGAKDQAGAKGKAPKGRGKKAKKQGGLGGSLVAPPAEPSWELLASSTDELQAVGEDLTGQPANAEADIGYQVTLQLTFRTSSFASVFQHTVCSICSFAESIFPLQCRRTIDNIQLRGPCGTLLVHSK